jgi:hypothetical protein
MGSRTRHLVRFERKVPGSRVADPCRPQRWKPCPVQRMEHNREDDRDDRANQPAPPRSSARTWPGHRAVSNAIPPTASPSVDGSVQHVTARTRSSLRRGGQRWAAHRGVGGRSERHSGAQAQGRAASPASGEQDDTRALPRDAAVARRSSDAVLRQIPGARTDAICAVRSLGGHRSAVVERWSRVRT